MQEKIMVSGTHGFVGKRVMAQFPQAIAMPSEVIRDAARAAQFVQQHQPTVVIHTAAISAIDACEADPAASYRANVQLSVALAQAAQKVQAKLVCFSSDQVYTGCSELGPYCEEAVLGEPTNTYARHKREMEQRVLDIAPSAVLLRATWMYDMPLYAGADTRYQNRGNLLQNTLRALLRAEKMQASDCQHRGITYVRQVVEHLQAAWTLPGGIYNYGSENPLSMYETLRTLLCALGAEHTVSALLEKTHAEAHPLWMDCSKLRQHGICFDTTAEGFVRCAHDYQLNK